MRVVQEGEVGRRAAEPVLPSLVRAARRELVDRRPVWFMRQAGRSLAEYRKVREKYDLFAICQKPELCAEVTMQPVRRLGVDGAVLFADIMLPVAFGLGVDVQLVEGVGPVIQQPIRTRRDIDRMQARTPAESVPFVLETIRLLRRELDPGVAVIGFSGAPFTLAGYLIEGKPSREFLTTKRLMYAEPALWETLMTRLSDLVLDYLLAQIEAGAQVVQVFDSWVGCLSPMDYRRYVLPHSAKMAARAAALLSYGNLDPAMLLGPWPVIEDGARRVIEAAGGRPGHIFNLGHGVLPDTPVEHLQRLTEFVHAT